MRTGVVWGLAAHALFGASLAAAEPKPHSPNTRAFQDAIDAAKSGARLRLPAGRFFGELRIHRPIVLRGAGPGRTVILASGRGPALTVKASRGRTLIEGITFTTAPDARKSIGAGVMLSGPGEIVIRNVVFKRTIVGRCLSGALSLDGGPKVILRRTRIEDHRCYLAGVVVVDAGAEVVVSESVIARNVGELAGAFLVQGGRLRLEGSRLDGNRFDRGSSGHHLVVAAKAEVQLVALDLRSPSGRSSFAVDPSAQAEIQLERMTWPGGQAPATATHPRSARFSRKGR